MILEALVKQYEALLADNKVPQKGWTKAKVSFALELNADGDLMNVITLKKTEQRGKKIVEVPQIIVVPEQIKKSSGIVSQFLCENSSYFLGIDNKGKPERSLKCFEAAVELHQRILAEGKSTAAIAVRNFFAKWKPLLAEQHQKLAPYLEEIKAGANLIFLVGAQYAQEDKEIRSLWQNAPAGEDAVVMQCLVTGEKAPIARLHPSIKGVVGAQSAGASLVSFNAPAYESYGRTGEQGLNAPVSEYAAFAYGTVLNQLLADNEHAKTLGDTTVVYWAEKNSEVYQDFFAGTFLGNARYIDDAQLESIFDKVIKNEEIDFEGIRLSYENPFYILGLAPNAARLSVRFFLQSTFGEILKNIAAHVERMKIEKPSFEMFEHIPLWMLLQETVSKNSREKVASPLMAGAVMRAILQNRPYPISLFQQIMLRIRAEEGPGKINYRRAAILKAYLNKNRYENRGGYINVGLNEEASDVEYVLGRLFAVLEHIQQSANPGINATIKDRYFDSACATPANVFPLLQKLANHHLRKLEPGKKVYFEKQLTSIMAKIEMSAHPLPKYLTLERQGAFILGYYHQTQKRYEKKEEKVNG